MLRRFRADFDMPPLAVCLVIIFDYAVDTATLLITAALLFTIIFSCLYALPISPLRRCHYMILMITLPSAAFFSRLI